MLQYAGLFFMLLIECFIQSCCQSQIADVGNLAKLFALQTCKCICCDVHVFAVGWTVRFISRSAHVVMEIDVLVCIIGQLTAKLYCCRTCFWIHSTCPPDRVSETFRRVIDSVYTELKPGDHLLMITNQKPEVIVAGKPKQWQLVKADRDILSIIENTSHTWALLWQINTHTHTHNSILIFILPRETGLASCLLNYSPFIPKLHTLLGQA